MYVLLLHPNSKPLIADKKPSKFALPRIRISFSICAFFITQSIVILLALPLWYTSFPLTVIDVEDIVTVLNPSESSKLPDDLSNDFPI